MHNLHTYYNLDSEIVLENLKTNISGLTDLEVIERQNMYGLNVFQEGSKNSLLKTFLKQFLSPLIFILIFASLITIYLNEHIETIVILSAVFINVFFSTYQEYKAENTIDQLKKIIKNKALVKRQDEILEIDAENLVIGDIVILQYGSRVPADIRLLEIHDLKTDESLLTGESLPVDKQTGIVTDPAIPERRNYCFCGTLITNGNGLGVVTHIGDHTEIGKIAKSISSTKKVLTPVQNSIQNISWYIFAIAIFIVIIVFILGVYRGESILEMLVLSSAVAVGAVPEALPIALTVILSIGVLNISKRGGLIRKLSAAETLGSTTLILTDKTGTLTEGNLKLENIITADNLHDFGVDSKGFSVDAMSAIEKEIILKASHNFSVVMNKNDDKDVVFSGNAFEVILSRIMHEQKIHNKKNITKIILPFNSSNKYSVSEVGDVNIILGAPDILIINSNLDIETKNKLLENIDILSHEGKRLIAIAEKGSEKSFSLKDIRIIGIFVFSDLIRSDIEESIRQIIQKGVMVKMITGDLPGTAKFIGNSVGIIADDNEIITGSQLTTLSDEDLKEILPKIKIFARVTPEDKLRIGKMYQELGEVVAMTGDGVNDSPALKAMDIGISLSSGSEVAKGASDMILIKDDFRTIVDTISEGHTIKKNIQKVFVYLMSNSLDEVFVVAGSLIAGLTLPLNALQIIWANILTGTLPALAFAYDKNKDTRSSGKSIFDLRIKVLALGIGTISSALLFILYYVLLKNISNIEIAQSIFFLCFSSYVLIISYSFIDLDKYIWQYNFLSNWRLNLGVFIGLILLFMSVYTKIGQNIFELHFVPVYYLWILGLWLFFNVWIVELSKFFFKSNFFKRYSI